MFAYRLAAPFPGTAFLTSDPDDARSTLITAEYGTWREAKRLWVLLKWDGSIATPIYFLTIPTVEGIQTGYLIQDNVGHTFIASPIPFPHIAAGIDYDAHIDSDEMRRTQAIILDETGELIEDNRVRLSWSRSRKGNMISFHDSVSITIFPDKREGGYGTVVTLANEKKDFLPRQPTEVKACQYVSDNFYQICANIQRRKNRFVRWSDADDPF